MIGMYSKKIKTQRLKMTNKFIFDVDGTLTPNRGIMDTEFKKFFIKFISDNIS